MVPREVSSMEAGDAYECSASPEADGAAHSVASSASASGHASGALVQHARYHPRKQDHSECVFGTWRAGDMGYHLRGP